MMKFKRIKALSLAALLVFSLTMSACEKSEEANVLKDQRMDIQYVASALVYKLQGSDANRMGVVTFAEGFEISEKTGLNLADFRLQKIAITKDISRFNKQNYRQLGMVLEFSDPGLRQALLAVDVDYILGDDVLYIEKASVEPVYLNVVGARTYILNTENLPSFSKIKEMEYPEFIEMVGDNLISKEELRNISPEQSSKLLIVSVSKYRYEPQAKFSLHLTGDNEKQSARIDDAAELNLNGWPVALAKGDFKLNGSPEFAVKTILTRTIDNKVTQTVADEFSSKF